MIEYYIAGTLVVAAVLFAIVESWTAKPRTNEEIVQGQNDYDAYMKRAPELKAAGFSDVEIRDRYLHSA